MHVQQYAAGKYREELAEPLMIENKCQQHATAASRGTAASHIYSSTQMHVQYAAGKYRKELAEPQPLLAEQLRLRNAPWVPARERESERGGERVEVSE